MFAFLRRKRSLEARALGPERAKDCALIHAASFPFAWSQAEFERLLAAQNVFADGAFDSRGKDAERWLRSDRKIRESFFKPAKLREASKGRFRGKDYSFHCELGGHPVPTGSILLRNEISTTELLLSDLLGHVGRIWDHFIGWAKRHEDYTATFKSNAIEMSKRFAEWKTNDSLTELPAP